VVTRHFDVTLFIMQNADAIKESMEPLAMKFYELKPFFDGVFVESFDVKYKEFICTLIIEEISGSFPDQNYEDFLTIVTPELIEGLLGADYFYY
jgi:hypothetical protein